MLSSGIRSGDQISLLGSDLKTSSPDLMLKRKQGPRSAEILFATVQIITVSEKSTPERYFEVRLPHSNAAPKVYLFGQVRDTILTDPSGAPREAVLAFKGLGLALAVACLVLSWFAKDDELSKTK